MNFLITEDEVAIINSDDIKLGQQVPLGFWKLDAAQFKGIFLKKTDFKLSHGKIYGKSQNIADHIVQAYKCTPEDKNMGVLLSGGRGLGKTLTTRLVIEQLAKTHPIIIVSDYFNGMVDFLENLKGCVILMDEFEKVMGGNIRGNDAENEQTKQETLLSLLDGNTGSSGNLFLLTVNNTYKLDENLKSRPGRIRYHYRFVSETADVVREYCKDNLNNKDRIEEVVKTLGGAEYVSMDIIASFVEELNNFPEMKPSEVIDYFNIESGNRKYTFTVIVRDKDDGNIYNFTRTCRSVDYDSMGLTPSDSRKYSELQKAEGNEIDYYKYLMASIDDDAIPAYIWGKEQIDPASVEIHSFTTFDNEQYEIEECSNLEIVGVTVEDPGNKGMKRYMGTRKVGCGDFVDL